MHPLVALLLLAGAAALAYRAGRLGQRFTQARADSIDARGKYRRARAARWPAAKQAAAGWGALLAALVVAGFLIHR